MTWQRVLTFTALSLCVVAACSDDPAPSSGSSGKAANGCPKDDPSTMIEESECKEIATIAAGKTAVGRRDCIRCHGDNMAGRVEAIAAPDTALGEKVELYPPNLTPDPETGHAPPEKGGRWTDDALALAIRTGVDIDSQQLCPQMTHFSDMSDFEVYSIVKYLRSLPPVKQKIPRSVCPPFKTKAQQGL